jgi:hypothetical protein
MKRCGRVDVTPRAHRTHLHDRPRQTSPCSVGERHSALQLRGAIQLHDRQMLAAGRVADRKIQSNTASASNAGARRSARGATRPVPSWLEPSCEASGSETLVDLVRDSTIQRFTRTISVVPGHEQRQLPSEVLSAVRHHFPNALSRNCLPWSVMRCLGAAPAFPMARPRNVLTATVGGC